MWLYTAVLHGCCFVPKPTAVVEKYDVRGGDGRTDEMFGCTRKINECRDEDSSISKRKDREFGSTTDGIH